ncbi:c-type cytochrome [Marivita sp. S0852]|uniref:c-type cytochrome n=1 Tax=Marivita sp. S0852 TaxID=3373893 RepID=UPI003982D19B
MRHVILIAATTASFGLAHGAGGQGANVLLNCTSCHTLAPDIPKRELSQTPPAPYPNLNGQSARYLERQLHAYRTGLRQHPQMQATATALGDGAAAMARMYSDAPAPDLVFRENDDTHAAAQRLVYEGDWSRGLPSCNSCHARDPDDRARLSPRLHGHPASYLTRQLTAYAEGTRQSGTMGRMRAFASKLTEQEISEIAAYYAAWREDTGPLSEAPTSQPQKEDSDG